MYYHPGARPMKPLHIFKPGKHVAMSGANLNFSEADLAATVLAYDPALHEAPLVIGHPKHDAPAVVLVEYIVAVFLALFSLREVDMPCHLQAALGVHLQGVYARSAGSSLAWQHGLVLDAAGGV